ncbi:interleukin 17-like protein [Pecten maximus]|uniref:interleukin 17-like protein n=1 Tax=Pecten maximus TaxID=6579 RepID=UPI001459094F|nr:interleukin 17-like protein [Pecten maximus]
MALSACIHTTSTCTTPATVNLAIQLRLARNVISSESILLAQQNSDSHNDNVTITVIEGETNVCPENLSELENTMDTLVRHRSTCPFYMVSEHNPYRYPATLTSVRCRCQKCLEFGGHSEHNVCEPVYVNEVVLMRGSCENGVYQYNPTDIKIQVACTCARAKEAESPESEGPIPL